MRARTLGIDWIALLWLLFLLMHVCFIETPTDTLAKHKSWPFWFVSHCQKMNICSLSLFFFFKYIVSPPFLQYRTAINMHVNEFKTLLNLSMVMRASTFVWLFNLYPGNFHNSFVSIGGLLQSSTYSAYTHTFQTTQYLMSILPHLLNRSPLWISQLSVWPRLHHWRWAEEKHRYIMNVRPSASCRRATQ